MIRSCIHPLNRAAVAEPAPTCWNSSSSSGGRRRSGLASRRVAAAAASERRGWRRCCTFRLPLHSWARERLAGVLQAERCEGVPRFGHFRAPGRLDAPWKHHGAPQSRKPRECESGPTASLHELFFSNLSAAALRFNEPSPSSRVAVATMLTGRMRKAQKRQAGHSSGQQQGGGRCACDVADQAPPGQLLCTSTGRLQWCTQ